MSMKPRKPTGSFLNDPSSVNLIQLSPRSDTFHLERSPYTLTTHSSKTNFIDTILPEGPRAVTVSKTGEKHSLPLNDDTFPLSTNPFSHIPVHTSQLLNIQTNVKNQSSATKVSTADHHPRFNSAKRSRVARHYATKKVLPVFTPRNLKHFTTFPLPPAVACNTERPIYVNAQTQTDAEIYSSNSTKHAFSAAYKYNPIPMTTTSTRLPVATQIISETLQMPRKFTSGAVGDDMQDFSARRQPLRVLASEKASFTNLAELRSIVSALTLLTIISWLFSAYFGLESIFGILSKCLQTLQHWYIKKEVPMTKAEILLQYIRNLWP